MNKKYLTVCFIVSFIFLTACSEEGKENVGKLTSEIVDDVTDFTQSVVDDAEKKIDDTTQALADKASEKVSDTVAATKEMALSVTDSAIEKGEEIIEKTKATVEEIKDSH